MEKVFLFLYLNNVSPLHKGKGWQVSTIFKEFPSVEEILDNTCLLSLDDNDVTMAKKLVETKGEPHRFVYDDDKYKFFECMIMPAEFGKSLDLWDLFITGYADSEEYHIKYIEEVK